MHSGSEPAATLTVISCLDARCSVSQVQGAGAGSLGNSWEELPRVRDGVLTEAEGKQGTAPSASYNTCR